MVEIFTDGSALSNKKDACAGWAICIIDEDNSNEIIKSGKLHATNNQAELFAISYSLWYSLNVYKFEKCKIMIKTDSQYAINILTGKMKPKINLKLIKGCLNLKNKLEDLGNEISFIHILAHTGKDDKDSKYNDIVDKLARKRAKELQEEEKK